MMILSSIDLSAQADATEHTIACPVCQHTRLAVLLRPQDVAAERRWLEQFRRQRTRRANPGLPYTQANPTWVLRCTACETLLRDPQPTCDTLHALYRGDTYGKDTLDQLAATQDAFFQGKARRLQPYLPAAAAVLEIGSFVGSFLRAAGELGWRATGVDVGEEMVAYTRAAGLNVLQGEFSDLPLTGHAWDGVFIWNTFEQLCAPGRVLERVRALLKAGGLLVLRIPNGAFESACLGLRRQWQGQPRAVRVLYAQAYNSFLTFPYLTGYTPTSIAALLHQHGFALQTLAGDTLVRLADRDTLPFAAQEEARYKGAVRRFCRRLEGTSGGLYYPWLDVIARAP